MKELLFAIIIAIASALSANAQVLTSKTINNVYEEVSHQPKSHFAFNAEWKGNDIITMFVYKKDSDRNGMLTLKPHMKYEYAYAADGTLTTRVAYRWTDSRNNWTCMGRHDYTLTDDIYYAEYSRYNHATNSFDQPVEKMVYTLTPYGGTDYVSYYQRDLPSAPYQLVSATVITNQPLLLAEQ